MTTNKHEGGIMMRHMQALALAAAMCAALTFTSVAPLAAADTITEANVAEHVASAKTPADHQALATYFNGQASAAGDKAKSHERMLETVKKTGRPSSAWKTHCKSLIKMYKNLQKDFESMAKEHEELAKKAAK